MENNVAASGHSCQFQWIFFSPFFRQFSSMSLFVYYLPFAIERIDLMKNFSLSSMLDEQLQQQFMFLFLIKLVRKVAKEMQILQKITNAMCKSVSILWCSFAKNCFFDNHSLYPVFLICFALLVFFNERHSCKIICTCLYFLAVFFSS